MTSLILKVTAKLFIIALIVTQSNAQSGSISTNSFESPIVSEVVKVGQELLITLKEDESFNFRGQVGQSGKVELPYLGEFSVAGRTLQFIQNSLTEILLENYYNTVTLSVSISGSGSGQIYIYGAVQEPGTLTIEENQQLTIPQAISLVNGLTSWANPANAYILRNVANGQQIEIPVDIRRIISNRGRQDSEFILQDQDELYIPGIDNDESQLLINDEREIIVVGQVNTPGIITFAPGEDCTLMRSIFKAGGLTKFARGNSVRLIRYRGGDRTVQVVDIEAIIEEGYLDQDIELFAGDMLIVPQKLVNF